MSGVWWMAGVLATWRVTHLVVAEDGPWNVVARLRTLAGNGFVGQLMDCFYCSSLWVAAPVAWWLGATWPERIIAWLSCSAGAIVLQRLLPGEGPPSPGTGA